MAGDGWETGLYYGGKSDVQRRRETDESADLRKLHPPVVEVPRYPVPESCPIGTTNLNDLAGESAMVSQAACLLRPTNLSTEPPPIGVVVSTRFACPLRIAA